MKRFSAIALFFSLLESTAVLAQEYDSPACVAVGRDAARSEIISYPTQEEALRFGRGPSKYLRPVTRWTQADDPAGTVFSGNFTMPFSWIERQQFLHVECASSAYEVRINGQTAGYVQNGTTPADFDITPYASEGKNDVAIVVKTRSAANRLERKAEDASSAVGEVYVLSQPRMRVRDIIINSALENDANGVLELGVVLKTHTLNPKTYRVYYELFAPDSTRVLDGYHDLTLDMRREDTVRFLSVIPKSLAWSAESPNLYTLVVKTRYEGRIAEYIPFKVGFRSVATDPQGNTIVNGRPVSLKIREADSSFDIGQLEMLKQLGYNTIRLHCGPLSRELLRRCDQLGFYVIDQVPIDTSASGRSIRIGGNPSNDPVWEAAYLDRTESNYHATKNHPSVIAFSIADRSANGINLYKSYLRLKQLEKHRPVIYPDAEGEWNSDRMNL